MLNSLVLDAFFLEVHPKSKCGKNVVIGFWRIFVSFKCDSLNLYVGN